MTKIHIKQIDQPFDYPADQPPLLDFLEKNNVPVQFNCREGFCGACRCKLVSGSVSYLYEPLAFVRNGEVLTCCSVALTDLELEIPN